MYFTNYLFCLNFILDLTSRFISINFVTIMNQIKDIIGEYKCAGFKNTINRLSAINCILAIYFTQKIELLPSGIITIVLKDNDYSNNQYEIRDYIADSTLFKFCSNKIFQSMTLKFKPYYLLNCKMSDLIYCTTEHKAFLKLNLAKQLKPSKFNTSSSLIEDMSQIKKILSNVDLNNRDEEIYYYLYLAMYKIFTTLSKFIMGTTCSSKFLIDQYNYINNLAPFLSRHFQHDLSELEKITEIYMLISTDSQVDSHKLSISKFKEKISIVYEDFSEFITLTLKYMNKTKIFDKEYKSFICNISLLLSL